MHKQENDKIVKKGKQDTHFHLCCLLADEYKNSNNDAVNKKAHSFMYIYMEVTAE